MKPRDCRNCGKTFTPLGTSGERPFCSRACYWSSLRGIRVEGTKHRTETRRGHPIAPRGGVTARARFVLYDEIGPGPHPCHWCGKEVNWTPGKAFAPSALHVDHLDWDAANDDAGNLVPSCNSCNSHRRNTGTSAPLQPGEPTVMRGGRPTRAVIRQCERCGEEFPALPADIRKGKGRFCSRSCARRKG